jgi:hypothetical protein
LSDVSGSFVVECFWPEVKEADLQLLDRRIRDALNTVDGPEVRYLGSILMCDDEVVLCQFEGDPAAVRAAAQRAEVPFARILRTTRLPTP